MDSIKPKLLSKAYSRDTNNIPGLPKGHMNSGFAITSSFEKTYIEPNKRSMAQTPVPHHFSSDESSDSDVELVTFEIKDEGKPICFLLLETYFRGICSELERVNRISPSSYDKALTMLKALNDCTRSMPSLSIFFYNLVRSALKDIRHRSSKREIMGKLLEISGFIEEKHYLSEEHPVSKYDVETGEKREELNITQLRTGLTQKLKNMNAKNFTLITKILGKDKDLQFIVKAYVTLIRQLDYDIDKKEDYIQTMGKLTNVPGKAAQITRKILPAIHKEVISIPTIRAVHELLGKVKSKEGVGAVLYDILTYTVKYFNKYAELHYGTTVLEEDKKFTEEDLAEERERVANIAKSQSPLKKTSLASTEASPFVPKKGVVKKKKFQFADPEKQKLLDSIMQHQRIENRFKMFLKDRIILEQHKANETDAVQAVVDNKRSLVSEFAHCFQLSKDDADRLGEFEVFRHALAGAVKLVDDPEFQEPLKPMSYFHRRLESC